jgi:hypothetical protein
MIIIHLHRHLESCSYRRTNLRSLVTFQGSADVMEMAGGEGQREGGRDYEMKKCKQQFTVKVSQSVSLCQRTRLHVPRPRLQYLPSSHSSQNKRRFCRSESNRMDNKT